MLNVEAVRSAHFSNFLAAGRQNSKFRELSSLVFYIKFDLSPLNSSKSEVLTLTINHSKKSLCWAGERERYETIPVGNKISFYY